MDVSLEDVMVEICLCEVNHDYALSTPHTTRGGAVFSCSIGFVIGILFMPGFSAIHHYTKISCPISRLGMVFRRISPLPSLGERAE